MMETWGGAQWIIVCMMAFRALFGILVATGHVKFNHVEGAWPTYFGRRFADLSWLLVMLWGGFF